MVLYSTDPLEKLFLSWNIESKVMHSTQLKIHEGYWKPARVWIQIESEWKSQLVNSQYYKAKALMGSFVRTSFKQHSQRNHTADVSYICWDLRVNEIDWLTSLLKQHTWFTAVNFVLNPAHHFSCQRNMSYVRNNVTVSAFTTADLRYSMGQISFISDG